LERIKKKLEENVWCSIKGSLVSVRQERERGGRKKQLSESSFMTRMGIEKKKSAIYLIVESVMQISFGCSFSPRFVKGRNSTDCHG
jgi:hypothetical protein